MCRWVCVAVSVRVCVCVWGNCVEVCRCVCVGGCVAVSVRVCVFGGTVWMCVGVYV